MNNYCVDVNLKLKIFNSSLTVIDYLKSKEIFLDRTKNKHFLIDHEQELTQEIKTFFDKLGMYIVLVEIFYLTPNEISVIHSDRSLLGDYAKLNYIFGGKDSIMKWYKVVNEPNKQFTSKINTPSRIYEISDVEQVHKQTVGQPSLVQVGCPHNIINGPEERFCVSIVFKNHFSQNRVTMKDAITKFKDYIV